MNDTDYLSIGRRVQKIEALEHDKRELVRQMLTQDTPNSEYRLQQLGRIEVSLRLEREALRLMLEITTGL